MNIYAVAVGASTLFIPLALLYRVLNPIKTKPMEAALWKEELEQGRAQRRRNNELHGATAVRSDAHKWTHEAETPVPGYVPVWASNGVMSVIIYVAPDNVAPTVQEVRNARSGEEINCEAKQNAAIEKKLETAFWCLGAPPLFVYVAFIIGGPVLGVLSIPAAAILAFVFLIGHDCPKQ